MSAARLVRSVLLIAAAGAPAALLGCGPPSAEVSGAITLNGQHPNLKGMQIIFTAADGSTASAPVGDDGAYKADMAPVGEVGVGFSYVPPEVVKQAKSRGKMPQPGAAPDIGPMPQPTPNPIPEGLHDAATSKVTCKVQPGKKNVFNYDIKP
jgi:hypothetical protein